MTHPLTDEMIEEIAQFEPDLNEFLKFNRSNDMRAAYDLAIEHVKNAIELKLEVLSGEWRLDQYETSTAIEDFCEDLIQTISPQEES